MEENSRPCCRRQHERCRFRRWKKKVFPFSFPQQRSYLAYPSGSDVIAADATREAAWTVFWVVEKRRFVSTRGCRKRRKRFFSPARFDLTRRQRSVLVTSRLASSLSLFLFYAARRQRERKRERTTQIERQEEPYPARDAAASRQSAKKLRRAGGGGRSGGRRRRAEHRRRRHRRGGSGRSPLLLLCSNATRRRHAAGDAGCHG